LRLPVAPVDSLPLTMARLRSSMAEASACTVLD
jgi:hypothetical protein